MGLTVAPDLQEVVVEVVHHSVHCGLAPDLLVQGSHGERDCPTLRRMEAQK